MLTRFKVPVMLPVAKGGAQMGRAEEIIDGAMV